MGACKKRTVRRDLTPLIDGISGVRFGYVSFSYAVMHVLYWTDDNCGTVSGCHV